MNYMLYDMDVEVVEHKITGVWKIGNNDHIELKFYDGQKPTWFREYTEILMHSMSFHNDAFWLEMKEKRPDEFAEAVDFDTKIRNLYRLDGESYLHKSGKPLSNVIFLHEGQQELFKFECEGMCGV